MEKMKELTEKIVAAVRDKKAREVAVLDLSGFDGAIADTFVICTADSTAQVEAIAHNVEKEAGEKVWRVEGMQNGVWVVMDYVNVMVHIFIKDARDFYKLDELWADAPRQEFADEE